MKYAVTFAAMAVLLVFQAVTYGGLWWALVWPGASFAIVASAYLGIGPCVFGKKADGTMAWYAVAALLPYLLLTWPGATAGLFSSVKRGRAGHWE
jgi:hypothetical protein